MKEKLRYAVYKILAKGGIAHHEQFLLLIQYFQNPSTAESSKCLCMRERVYTEL